MWTWRIFTPRQPGVRAPTGNLRESGVQEWEVPDLLSWITCLGIYASVIYEKSPEKPKHLLAYQTLFVREAH